MANGNGNGALIKWLMGIIAVIFTGMVLGFAAHIQSVTSEQAACISDIKTEQRVQEQRWKDIDKRLERIEEKLDKLAEAK